LERLSFNMKLDSENSENFEALRKIMAVKRHEQPPPGYMHYLPGRIMSRIEHGDGQLTFWERISSSFVLRPSLAYAFGLTVCGAVALSAVYTVQRDHEPVQAMNGPTPGFGSRAIALGEASTSPVFQNPPLHVANWLGNTNPATFSSEPSLFAPVRQAIPASYEPGY
jgi:hypothetical protein